MLRGWCWYVLGYGMDLVQEVMDVEFMGVSEGGEVWVGALCVKVWAVSRGGGCGWLAVWALFHLWCYCFFWCVFSMLLLMDCLA